MCRIVEEIVEKERAEMALRMIADGSFTFEQISRVTGISLDEIKKLADRTSA